MTGVEVRGLRSRIAEMRDHAAHCRKLAARHEKKAQTFRGMGDESYEQAISIMYRNEADDLELHARSFEGFVDAMEEVSLGEMENAHDGEIVSAAIA